MLERPSVEGLGWSKVRAIARAVPPGSGDVLTLAARSATLVALRQTA
ncbi:MAG TPA: hypothetical protein VJQ45_11585 [Ktedonobacterales bacterium]|nr:hypothetical protein [Ktedonobacterales bacterium]